MCVCVCVCVCVELAGRGAQRLYFNVRVDAHKINVRVHQSAFSLSRPLPRKRTREMASLPRPCVPLLE